MTLRAWLWLVFVALMFGTYPLVMCLLEQPASWVIPAIVGYSLLPAALYTRLTEKD